jgi:N-hydroxyarylamine O-acetyltransferase
LDVQAYFDRIGFQGRARPDLATLRALHRGHSFAIPYENLDVQLGRPLTTDPAAAFDKIVRRRRGGWCYEMNGLFGAVLQDIGFQVTRLAGAAMRKDRGDSAIGNHLVLLVQLPDGPWVADVGFGDGSRDPYPLQEGPVVSDGYAYDLARLDGDWWRLTNHPFGGAPSFDFTLEPADPTRLAAKCHELQTSPESGFVLNAVAQRHVEGEIRLLRGRSFRRLTPHGHDDSLVANADAFVALLRDEFALDLPEAAGLWPKITARHDELFPPAPAET